MGLSNAARAAREIADRSIDRGDHALANALEAAVWCEEDDLDERLWPPHPTVLEGLPPPPVDVVQIPKPPPPDPTG